MVIAPQTEIKLLKVPLTLDNKNQITFSNVQSQFNYFNSLPSITLDNATYLRKEGVIRFDQQIDSILQYNYIMYQNESYSNKWFYGFITNMVYKNDNMTDIYFTLDVFQTWQFDIIFKESFVEREMINVSEDVPGANLLPEGLETGEYTIAGTAEFDELEPIYIVAFTGDKFNLLPVTQNGNSYNGIWSSVKFILTDSLQEVLGIINNEGNSDKILTVFTIPKLAVKSIIDNNPSKFYNILENHLENPIRKTLLPTPNSLNGYIPRNQKLRTFPFCYLGFNPQNGSPSIFRYEDFSNGSPSFDIISEINPNPTVQFIPLNYRGQSENLTDVVSLNGYPNISYKNDVYNTWLAQNSQIITLSESKEKELYNLNTKQSILDFVSSLGSVAGGNLESASTAMGVINQYDIREVNHEYFTKELMAQQEQHKLLPDTASLSSSNSTLLGYNKFDKNIFSRYTIKYQFAERIDKYFDMYGYQTNLLKIPNINNRPNWNYIKTVTCNIIGDIPETNIVELKSLFNSGITLWHNPSTFLDYSQNNR